MLDAASAAGLGTRWDGPGMSKLCCAALASRFMCTRLHRYINGRGGDREDGATEVDNRLNEGIALIWALNLGFTEKIPHRSF